MAGKIRVSVTARKRRIQNVVGAHLDAFDPVPGAARNSFLAEKSGSVFDLFKGWRGRIFAILEGKLEGEADAQSGNA